MRRRLDELDLLRAVAAVAVVVIHVSAALLVIPAGAPPRSFWWAALLNQAARFSIGAFVLITGVALCYTYRDRPGFSAREFYARRLRGVALPYVAWSALYVLWAVWVERDWAGLPHRLLLALLRGDAMYHLYFVVLILQFYLLFPLILAAVGRPWFPRAAAAALAAQFALNALVFYRPSGFGPAWLAATLHYSDRLFPWWMGYFAVGAWMAGRVDALRAAAARWAPAAFAAAAALLAVMMTEFALYMRNPHNTPAWAASEFRPSALAYSLVLSLAVLAAGALGAPARQLWSRLAHRSFGVYLAHPLVLGVLTSRMVHLHLGPVPYFVGLTAAVLVGAYVITRALEWLPGLAWTVGLGASRARVPAAGSSG